MATEIEKKNITGLDQAADRKEAEYDLVKSLLEAAEYQTAEDNITEAEIKRSGKFMFSVHLHPISDLDVKTARKKATTYMPNPNGRKLPKIEKEFDSSMFNSWLIYLATTEDDQQNIWGNPTIMQKFGLMQPVESIDVLLKVGEKRRLSELVLEISGLNDDDEDEAVYDEETFQS